MSSFVIFNKGLDMEVTNIEKQKKHKDRVNIYVDGEFYCGMTLFNCMKYRLKVGVEIDEEHLKYIKNVAEREVAIDKAMNYLSKQQKTEMELKKYLLSKGFEEEIIAGVLDKLKEYSYIDDKKYAMDYIKSYSKNSGRIKISYDLRLKGIDDEIIANSLDSFEFDDGVVLELLTKYMKGKTREAKTKQKAYRFLASKGFENDKIIHALSAYWDGDEMSGENEDEHWN